MRFALLILTVAFFLPCLGQQARVAGTITDTTGRLDKEPVALYLIKSGTKWVSCLSAPDGSFRFEDITPGVYQLVLQRRGDRPEFRDSLILAQGQHMELSLRYPSACPYIYPEGYIPRCPYGHSEGIIPIRYGKPARESLRLVKEGRIRLGGCITTECDPKYYCPLHQKEF